MAMTNAERQRKYREKRNKDPEKRQSYLEKEKQKYQKDKLHGTKKLVKDMSEREKRSIRKKWKIQKQKYRAQKKVDNDPLEALPSTSSDQLPSRQKVQSLKKKSKDISKCYRDNQLLQQQLNEQKRKTELYKKRWQRMKSKQASKDSPRTKTRHLLRHLSPSGIRKTLTFHNVLISQLKESYKKSPKITEKQRIAKILSGGILRKYKMKSVAFNLCGIKQRKPCNEKTCLSRRLFQKVREFYVRDDVSRLTAGLKSTVTSKKVKKQRRILNDTLKNLYLKYCSENNSNLSYTTFCRLRPFWVLHPTERDRNTCLCKTCENTQYMASSLHKIKATDTDNLEDIVKDLVCNIENKDCMYGECLNCNEKRVDVKRERLLEETTWNQWRNITEKRTIKSGQKTEEKEVTFTTKESKTGLVADLVQLFEDQLPRYKKHLFNNKQQYKYFKEKSGNLHGNECLIHIDFSENYVCKMSAEVQSMHFAASKKQLSLHTGVYYIDNPPRKITFSTISENLQHSPGAIWAHLKPVLTEIREKRPEIDTVEFFSDGPTTQYRQKGNFYMFCNEIYKFGFVKAVWNFFEAGHGKGIPDAVGGALKRNADRAVKYGKDITSAALFIEQNKESDVRLYGEINDDHISHEVDKISSVTLKPIPGTMKLHQLLTTSPGEIYFRDVSCHCRQRDQCKGHELRTANLSAENPEKSQNETRKVSSNVYENYLKELKSCKSFKKLQEKCKAIAEGMPKMWDNCATTSILECLLEIDEESSKIIPDDIPDSRKLVACKVAADGDCLPSCGSVFAFGVIEKTVELRVRILTELALNEESYLANEFLENGLFRFQRETQKNLPSIYAQYSDMYEGNHLTDNLIRNLFHKEVLNVRLSKAYMGIWQIHALASVLGVPVYSIYPKLGDPAVRMNLNRRVMPRVQTELQINPLYILWTSTRKDMNEQNWVPNHFVPVLPIDSENRIRLEYFVDKDSRVGQEQVEYGQENRAASLIQEGETLDTFGMANQESERQDIINREIETEDSLSQESRTVDMDNQQSEEQDRVGQNEEIASTVGQDNDTGDMVTQEGTKEDRVSHTGKTGDATDKRGEAVHEVGQESETGVTVCQEGDAGNMVSERVETKAVKWDQISDPLHLIGKYVAVEYDKLPYRGYVLDAGQEDIYVECMHRIGRKSGNCFYWPKKIKDKCWYDYENVLAQIPEPKAIEGTSHFMVDPKIWELVCNKVSKNNSH